MATTHKTAAIRPPTTKTIQVRRTRHAGYCWRSKDELISDILLWTPSYGRAKVGQTVRTYIQQLCADTECILEDLPEAMDNRDKWRVRFREIRAGSTIWWWLYIVLFGGKLLRRHVFLNNFLFIVIYCSFRISGSSWCKNCPFFSQALSIILWSSSGIVVWGGCLV